LETAKWLWTLAATAEFAFSWKWLEEWLEEPLDVTIRRSRKGPVRKVDIHAMEDGAFRSACRNGHLETAKWLLTLDPERTFWREFNLVKEWGPPRATWIQACIVVE
jgi:hypothetical protein